MIYLTAIVLGLAGSLHCAGMCGPLALALPGSHLPWRQLLGGRLQYNLGRSVTYAALGALMGLLGFGLAATPVQQYLSIVSGVLILLMLVLARPIEQSTQGPLGRVALWVRVRLGKLLGSRPGAAGQFAIGLVNGLLPCGLVYAALAGATGTGSVAGGMLYMFIFGLGTLPMMLTLSLMGKRIFSLRGARLGIRVVTIVVALLLIVRGLNLGIPYISPQFAQATADKPAQMKCGGEHCKLKMIE